jgi:FkbM family methyltransferase
MYSNVEGAATESFRARSSRFTSRVLNTLVDARDMHSRMAALQCVAGWAQLKRRRPVASRETTLRFHDITLMIDTSRAELISYWEVWHEHIYDSIPGFCPHDAECVIDVGANIGSFCLYQTMKKRAKLLIAYEPSVTVSQRLIRNLELNGVKNVRVINAAVGESCGEAEFIELGMSINSRVAQGGERGTSLVKTLTLDSSIESLGLRTVGLLKIDTEGYEIQVLKGAPMTLSRTERVVIEIHRELDRNEIQNLLWARAFKFVARKGNLLFYSR